LFVNGRRIGEGPARGDLQHWRYQRIDLAPYLVAGTNIVAIEVWNDADAAPLAQISSRRTVLLIEAEDQRYAQLIDGGPGWRVRVDRSRSVSPGIPQLVAEVGPTFYAAGGAEVIEAARQVTDWAAPRTNATDWRSAVAIAPTDIAKLSLVPNLLPPMAYRAVPSGRVVRATGVTLPRFPLAATTVPANSEATILVDAGRVLAAYPTLITSGGAGARVTMTYSEALYDAAGHSIDRRGEGLKRLHDRAAVADGLARGLTDTFLPDGSSNRRLQPFWWRAWRFVEIRVRTGSAPLTLERLETHETGYPFVRRGHFVSSDAELSRIWMIGRNTALFDAHETYMDTAYWEQLQYIGDTRIQMLVSYDVAGDPRLAIQALEAFDHSRVVEGLPQSAWPETNKNVIPPFALLWIGALHDYWMRQPDKDVVVRTLPGIRSVLDWYSGNLAATGIVQETSGWPFVDWAGKLDGWAFRGGKGPQNCVITMQYYGALKEAADLEAAVGDPARGAQDRAQAERVRTSLDAHCWDSSRGLYADTPDKDQFSQHAGILAVLYDVLPKDRQRAMLAKITMPGGGIAAPEGLIGSTYYFSFYLARAFDHAGLGDRYIGMLTPWRTMLQQHFTTFPETPDPSRSDSHAWTAHPTSGLLTYVAGIQSAAPGFARVRIAPHLGSLTSLDAAMAHPKGLIETRYALRGGELRATIRLPQELSGIFTWGGWERVLKGGLNTITIHAKPGVIVPQQDGEENRS
ncbi:MAG: hypothetical protein JF615_09240, partial [Asticcacaulis sp.]|nr:hypothetical protein [Asticcacaulis sp.]